MACIKGAIFDLDGTLLDTEKLWEDIDREFFFRRGIDFPSDYIEAVNAMSFRASAEYTIKRFSLPDTPECLMEEWNRMARYAYGHTVRLYPGCRKYLEAMREGGIKLAIATDLERSIAESSLASNGILSLFDALATTGEVGEDKRSARVFLQAAKALSLRCDECIVYEDLPGAEETARNAGFMTKDAASFHKECSALP